VQENDIIVIASDGLWDNMYDMRVIEIIQPFIRDTDKILDPELVASLIAENAE